MPEIIAVCADRSNYEPVAESTGMIRKPFKPAGRKETADRKISTWNWNHSGYILSSFPK